MIFYDPYFKPIAEVDHHDLGFSSENPQYIPEEYLENKQFLIFRTCHGYGDWAILSAMPRLLKQKYPDCEVYIPHPTLISKYFSPVQWQNKSKNPFNNVIEVFSNNPYVDGVIDNIPEGLPVFHDHFRIYDPKNYEIPLIQQMLKFWRFENHEMQDCEPELYWSEEEKSLGDSLINKIFNDKEFGFLYIDEDFFYSINMESDKLNHKRQLIQQEILKHDLPWLYFMGSSKFKYITNNRVVNIKDFEMSLRVQNYIKSKSKVIIGYMSGYGTDCMSRYSNCYVVAHSSDKNEHILYKTNYLN